MAKKPAFQFVCQSCGVISGKWQGQCTSCGEWNTLVEEKVISTGRVRASGGGGSNLAPRQTLEDIRTEQTTRLATGIDEFDELIGGGLVPGGITLIGGEPGVGKSTFMLQLASRLGVTIKPIVYVSGEESATQIKMRADRLKIGNGADIFLIAEQNLDVAVQSVAACLPRLMIVDSIQTVFLPQLEATTGSVGQIRECAAFLTRFGKERNLPILIIGHVTKQGAIAGPKILEHIVDTVMYFEGDVHSNFRILRVFKNRYGATGEVTIFQMTSNGLWPVQNPSDLFVHRTRSENPGVVVVPLLEGSRCILAELQALVTQSFLAMPRRVVAGLDSNRLNLVIAVLEKHAGLKFYNRDVFANVAGGLRLGEPGGDLGLAMALVSSAKDRPLPNDLLLIGELTLAGEIRPVARMERRVAEGRRFGFKRFLVPQGADVGEGSSVLRASSIREAVQMVFPGS